jgi:hypothetical protein
MHSDPQTSRAISALLDDIERPNGELTAPDGRVYQKRSAPEPGVRTTLDVTTAGGAPERVLTIFEPQPERPASYPTELPFVAGVTAMVNPSLKTVPAGTMVLWPELHDADAFDRTLLELSVADGWEVTAESKPIINGFTSPRELRRGTERRLVSRLPAEPGKGSSIMLIQT